MFSQIKDRKNIKQNFHSVARVMPWDGTRGAGGVKDFSLGMCDGAPSTAHSSHTFVVVCYLSFKINVIETFFLEHC